MWDYIVLGQVPGTSIQVSFESWLLSVATIIGTIIAINLLRRLARSRWLAAVRIGLIIQHASYISLLARRQRQHLQV